MNRRIFLTVIGSSAAAIATSALAADGTPATTTGSAAEPTDDPSTTLDAGPVDSFPNDGVYEQFRDQGVLLIRRAEDLFALSPVCTHRGCKVRPQDDGSFLCKCHRSHFDPDGHVLTGPAVRDLLRLKVKLSPEQHVLVRVAKPRTTG